MRKEPVIPRGKAKKKNTKKNRNKNPRKLIVIVIVVAAMAWTISPSLSLIKQSIERKKLEEQLRSINKKNSALKQEIDDLSKNKSVESIARKELDMARPDEETYVVISPDDEKNLEKKDSPHKKKEQSVFQATFENIKYILGLE